LPGLARPYPAWLGLPRLGLAWLGPWPGRPSSTPKPDDVNHNPKPQHQEALTNTLEPSAFDYHFKTRCSTPKPAIGTPKPEDLNQHPQTRRV